MTGIGVLGCAHIHTLELVSELVSRRDVVLRGVWDSEPGRAARICEAHPSLRPVSVDGILGDPKITAVLVCAETAQHSQIISQVVQAGKHLFVEKPLAHNVADARAIRDQVSGSGLVFQTGFFLRYAPEIAQVQTQSPFLSHVLTHDGWTAGWFHGDHAWMADTTAAGTGGFGDLGIHCLDLLLHLKGHHFVNAEVRVERDPQRDLDLSGEALLGFADTSRATFRAGWQGTAVNALSDGERTVGLSAKPVDALLAFVDELAGRPRSLIPVEEACERTVSMLALLRDAT